MTPLMITLFIVTGIAILIAIGYLNNVVENNKLEKVRQQIDYNERLKRCGELNAVFPGQFTSPALKLLMTRLELNLNQRMLGMNKRNTEAKARIDELQALIAKGEEIVIDNPKAPIQTEARAKEVRQMLEMLHHQVARATKEGFLPASEGKRWIAQIKHILVLLHIEFFTNLGQYAMQQGQPGQARLAFERGVQYLKKQPEPALYQAQLAQLEGMLGRSNAMVLDSLEKETESEDNELNAALKADEENDEFKQRKALYD